MDIEVEITYPDATVEDVMAMLTNPDFRTEVSAATGALDQDIDIESNDDGSVQVNTSRTLPAEVPDFVKKFVGDTITLVQEETWPASSDGERVGDLALRVLGQPASMSGSITVSQNGSGVVELIAGVLTVSVPFIGGKMEAEVAKGLRAAAKKEQEVGRAWLAR